MCIWPHVATCSNACIMANPLLWPQMASPRVAVIEAFYSTVFILIEAQRTIAGISPSERVLISGENN